MNEWDVFRPQEMAQHEEPAAAEAEQEGEVEEPKSAEARAERAASPRIAALIAERDEAERRLQEALLDLETREHSPAYQKAKELFDAGVRVKHASVYTDSDYAVFDYFVPGQDWKEVTVMKVKRSDSESRPDYSQSYIANDQEKVTYEHIDRTIRTGNIINDLTLEKREDNWSVIQQIIDFTESD